MSNVYYLNSFFNKEEDSNNTKLSITDFMIIFKGASDMLDSIAFGAKIAQTHNLDDILVISQNVCAFLEDLLECLSQGEINHFVETVEEYNVTDQFLFKFLMKFNFFKLEYISINPNEINITSYTKEEQLINTLYGEI